MPRAAGSAGSPPPGLLGLYALTVMEKEGAVHGYGVAERIAQRTEGAWRPGPGAVYPSLRKLERRGWARPRTVGRRTEYEITAAGRRFLAHVRRRQSAAGSSRLDLSVLWAEVAGSEDVDEFLLLRLRRTLDDLRRRLERPGHVGRSGDELRDDVVGELTRSLTRLRTPAAGRGSSGVSP